MGRVGIRKTGKGARRRDCRQDSHSVNLRKGRHNAKIQEYKDAWIALTALKQERQDATRHGDDGVTVNDWWHQEASKRNEMDDQLLNTIFEKAQTYLFLPRDR